MNKQSALEQIREEAFRDEMEKVANDYSKINFKKLMKMQVKEFDKGGFNNPKFVAINNELDRREHN